LEKELALLKKSSWKSLLLRNQKANMSSEQTFRLFTLLNKHFKNEEDSRMLVAQIEGVVDQKFDLEVKTLATKSDISSLKEDFKADFNRLEKSFREDQNRMEVRMEAGFKDQLKWIILLMMGMTSLIITVVKIL